MKKFSLFVLGVLVAFSFVTSVRADDATPPVDTTPPVITLVGDASVTISQGATYTDSGATASDDVDGDITTNIHLTGTVDTTTTGSYTLTYSVSDAAGNPATSVTRTVTVTPIVVHPATETVLIRNGNSVIDQETVSLPASGTVTITDDTGATHSVNADSVLGLLFAMSQSGTFSLSDLAYYSSMSSFYLKCVTPNGGSALCDNWQFVVGGTSPWTSIDQTILSGGETVGIYFGTAHRVRFDTTQVNAGGSVHATAEQYNYLDNTWSALTGVSIGVTVPNLNDPYNPTVVSSSVVDAQGNAMLSFPNAGTFSVGIVEDYYFPSYTVTTNAVVQSSGGGGGSSSGGALLENTTPKVATTSFDTTKAFAFLKKNQNADGSFAGGDMYTDWAGVAFGAVDTKQSDDATQKLIQYLKTHALVQPRLTDYERRAMAELALGQNPYTFGGVDVVTPIVKAFDGTQFGDANLINDDAFALIALESAGYTNSDSLITKDTAYILSKQGTDGSWEGGADMTSSIVQALSPLANVVGVSDSLAKASAYLGQSQSNDGGFGSVYTTSWVAQAMNILTASWTKNGHDPLGFLSNSQQSDGGLLLANDTIQNRVWATSYAIPAGLGLSWSSIMHIVNRPDPVQKIDQIVPPVTKIVSLVASSDVVKTKAVARHNLGALNTALAVDALENQAQAATQAPAEQPHQKRTMKQSVIAFWHTLVHTLTSW